MHTAHSRECFIMFVAYTLIFLYECRRINMQSSDDLRPFSIINMNLVKLSFYYEMYCCLTCFMLDLTEKNWKMQVDSLCVLLISARHWKNKLITESLWDCRRATATTAELLKSVFIVTIFSNWTRNWYAFFSAS